MARICPGAVAVIVLTLSLNAHAAEMGVGADGSVSADLPSLRFETLNQNVVKAEYAVRGAVLDRSFELNKMLKAGKKLPFKKTISCNIGNPQSLQQKPLSFNRQVLALVLAPFLLDSIPEGEGTAEFPADVVARARAYLAHLPSGAVGAYSNSQGIPYVRQEVADFLRRRDGADIPASPDNIFLTDGASAGVRMLMQLLVRSSKDGMLVPIPQYPLYSALTTVADGTFVPYFLDELAGWGVNIASIEKGVEEARAAGVNVRGLVVINPGNPTGQLLDPEGMRAIIRLCHRENIVLLADEVYQENVWIRHKKFVSFKKMTFEMGLGVGQTDRPLQLVSFHSTSKGFIGECGLRGGYFETHGIAGDVLATMYKLASITLCSNTVGQLSTGLMVHPPAEGEPSRALYVKERDDILSSLERRAKRLSATLNKLEGVTCQEVEGAMYAFPAIVLPKAVHAAAAEKNLQPDAFYCLEALEETGIIMVPGSGFKQVEGTWHFRTTFLPPENEMDEVAERLAKFHSKFMGKYRDA